MRKPHYWKQAGASSAPSEIVVVDTETHYGKDTLTPYGEWHTLRLGCALAYRLEKGKRTRVHKLTFHKVEEFWELVYSRLDKRRPVWVVGHNLPYDLGVLCGWKLIFGEDYHAEKVCIGGQMFYVKGSINGCGLNFLDTVNYYHCSLAKVGKSVGVKKLEMPTQDSSDADWERYCMNDVEVTARGIEALIAFNRKHALGPFQPSIAGNAFAAYRSSFMQHKVLVHCDYPSLRLERDCYYGGIVDTAYIGSVPREHIYELDVCSMYPAMCQHPLPVKWLGYSERMGLRGIQDLARRFIVFADVTLKNSKHQYPCRGKLGTYHPIGTYRTALAHPELMEAIERGYVSYVHRVSWYTKAPIFAEYMQFFVKHKIQYGKDGNESMENACKLYATNLYGKTGQTTPKWMVWGRQAFELLEQTYALPQGALARYYKSPPDYYHHDPCVIIPELPKPVECRTDFGEIEIRVGEHESRDSCPAIAACVTSYARVLLRQYQEIAKRGHWFYSDTDSIWVDNEGLRNLENAGCVRPQTLGYLDFKDIHFYLDIFGAKDYCTDLCLKRKGVRINAEATADGGWEQLQFPGPLQQIRAGHVGGVMVQHVVKHLHRKVTRCVVGADGYTRPLIYPDENPERVKRKVHREQA